MTEPRSPKEGDLLFFLLLLPIGAKMAARGTFYKPFMGTWSGVHVHIAGWLLLCVCAWCIFAYFWRHKALVRVHPALVYVFALLVIAAAILPFMSPLDIGFSLRIYHVIAVLLLFGHFVHKVLHRRGDPA